MANVGDLSVQLKADDNASGKIKNAAKRINGSLNSIKKGSLIASAAILGGFSLSVKQFLDTGDALHKLSQRTGMTARDLDALGHFAELSGQDLKLFEVMTKFLTKQMVSLSEGAVVQTEAFAKLGFSFQSLTDLTPTDRIVELVAALADIEDEVQRDIIGFDIFGGQMIKVKNLIGTFTGKELKDFIRAQQENSFWTDKVAEEAAVFNDTIAETKRELNMIVLELVRGHIPAMQASAGAMLDWVILNKEAILETARLALTFAKVVFALKLLSFAFNTFLRPAVMLTRIAFKSLTYTMDIGTKTFGIWHGMTVVWAKGIHLIKTAFLATKAAVLGFRLSMILTMVTAVVPFLVPIGIAVAVIGGLIAVFWGLNKVLKGALVGALKDAWNWVKGLGEKLGWLKGMWEAIVETVKGWTGNVKDAASSVKDRLIPSFEDVIEVIDPLQEDFEGLQTVITDTIEPLGNMATGFSDLGIAIEEEVISSLNDLIVGMQDFELEVAGLSTKLIRQQVEITKVKVATDDAAEAFKRYQNIINNYTPRGMKAEAGPFDYLGAFPALKGAGASVALMAAVKKLPSMKGATQSDIAGKMEEFQQGSSKNIFAISDASIAKAKYNFDKVNSAQ